MCPRRNQWKAFPQCFVVVLFTMNLVLCVSLQVLQKWDIPNGDNFKALPSVAAYRTDGPNQTKVADFFQPQLEVLKQAIKCRLGKKKKNKSTMIIFFCIAMNNMAIAPSTSFTQLRAHTFSMQHLLILSGFANRTRFFLSRRNLRARERDWPDCDVPFDSLSLASKKIRFVFIFALPFKVKPLRTQSKTLRTQSKTLRTQPKSSDASKRPQLAAWVRKILDGCVKFCFLVITVSSLLVQSSSIVVIVVVVRRRCSRLAHHPSSGLTGHCCVY